MRKCRIFNLLVVLILSALPSAYAQDITITGRVTDISDGLFLDGATVTVKNTKAGQSVDAKGNYSIKAPADAILVFSFLGYVTQEIPVNNRGIINVKMRKSESRDMNEVVVVGYKSVRKKDLTGAVASVNVKDLEDIPAPSLINLLAGKAPGVHAVVRSGLPGGSGVRLSARSFPTAG